MIFECSFPFIVHHHSLISLYMYLYVRKGAHCSDAEMEIARFRFLYVNHCRMEQAMKGNVRDS